MQEQTISLEGLTEEQLKMMYALGLLEKPKKVKKVKNPITQERLMATRNTCPDEEYYLRLTKVCDCCGSLKVLTGKMRQLKSFHSYLSFDQKIEIPDGEAVKFRRVNSLTCSNCEEKLMEKSKEELIKMLKGLHEGRML